jgi:hypothetical protein
MGHTIFITVLLTVLFETKERKVNIQAGLRGVCDSGPGTNW